jgi:hypothetical protein
MDKLAESFLNDELCIGSTVEYILRRNDYQNNEEIKNKYVEIVKRELDEVFQNITKTEPTNMFNLIDNFMDYLECYAKEIRGLHYLKARIDNCCKMCKVTPEDLYRVRVSDFCDWSGGYVKFPNGWKASMRGRDGLTKISYEENKHKCLRFYLSNNTMTDNYPNDYFRSTDSKFWQISKLEWVDFDDCSFNQLEPVFEWLNANEPSCFD